MLPCLDVEEPLDGGQKLLGCLNDVYGMRQQSFVRALRPPDLKLDACSARLDTGYPGLPLPVEPEFAQYAMPNGFDALDRWFLQGKQVAE